MSIWCESELHLRNKKTRLACTRAKWKQTYTVKTMLLKRPLCPLSRHTLVFIKFLNYFRKNEHMVREWARFAKQKDKNERIAWEWATFAEKNAPRVHEGKIDKKTYTVKTMLLKRQLCPLSRDTLVLESHFPKTQEDLTNREKQSVRTRSSAAYAKPACLRVVTS